jgi:hypothetical protein
MSNWLGSTPWRVMGRRFGKAIQEPRKPLRVGDEYAGGIVTSIDHGGMVTVQMGDIDEKAWKAQLIEDREQRGIRVDVCYQCNELIEHFNDVWWKLGTCGSVCRGKDGKDPDQAHKPILNEPPLHDRAALEKWLES